MRFSLNIKLLLLAMVVLAIPALVTGLSAYREVMCALETGVEQRLEDEAKSKAALVSAALRSVSDVAAAAAHNAALREAAQGNNTDLALAALKELRAGQRETCEDGFIADASGEIVASAVLGIHPGYTLEELGFTKQAAHGQGAFGEVVASKITGKPILAVVQPLVRDEEFIGMAGVTVDLANVAQRALQAGDGYLLNNAGLVVYHPREEFMLKLNMLHSKEPQLRELVEAVVNGKSGRGRYTYEGMDKLAAYAPAGQFALVVTAPREAYLTQARAMLRNIIFAMLLGAALSLMLIYVLRRQAFMPARVPESAEPATGGGETALYSQVPSNDETERLVLTLRQQQARQTQQLGGIVAQMANADESAAEALTQHISISKEMFCAVQALFRGTESGSEAVAELSRNLAQRTDFIQLVETKADAAKNGTSQTLVAAGLGVAKAAESKEAVQASKTRTEQVSRTVGELDQYIRQIGQFNELIAAIAARTDGLALHTAIEAARAGEQGRDFVRIAEDIRKLAEEAGEKTREIRTLVKESEEKTEDAAAALDNNSVQLDRGVSVIDDMETVLAQITATETQTAAYIEGIAAAAAEETGRFEQVLRESEKIAVLTRTAAEQYGRLSAMSTEQGAVLQKVNACVQEINRLANQLKEYVGACNI